MVAEIIWIVTWPVLVWFSYEMTKLAIKKFEKNEENLSEK